MVFDAVSLHKDRMLSMESFVNAIERAGGAVGAAARAAAAPGENPFQGIEPLPSIHGAVDLLVQEALRRAGGNQTIAARLIGVTQSALSKRLKSARS